MNKFQRYDRLFGLIGHPLGHSFSQQIFNLKFDDERINARYVNFDIENLGLLSDIIDTYPNLAGLNVTIPYKELILAFLDEVAPDALSIGAVNTATITREHNGRPILKGFNTDYIGFTDSVKSLIEPGDKALVLGTGGASKAIVYALRRMGIDPLCVSRTSKEDTITYAEIDKNLIKQYRIIVNATPLGTHPDVAGCPDIPFADLTPRHLCCDLVYNPAVTTFMSRAAAAGATVRNGLGMLLGQAAAAWDIWNSKTNHS